MYTIGGHQDLDLDCATAMSLVRMLLIGPGVPDRQINLRFVPKGAGEHSQPPLTWWVDTGGGPDDHHRVDAEGRSLHTVASAARLILERARSGFLAPDAPFTAEQIDAVVAFVHTQDTTGRGTRTLIGRAGGDPDHPSAHVLVNLDLRTWFGAISDACADQDQPDLARYQRFLPVLQVFLRAAAAGTTIRPEAARRIIGSYSEWLEAYNGPASDYQPLATLMALIECQGERTIDTLAAEAGAAPSHPAVEPLRATGLPRYLAQLDTDHPDADVFRRHAWAAFDAIVSVQATRRIAQEQADNALRAGMAVRHGPVLELRSPREGRPSQEISLQLLARFPELRLVVWSQPTRDGKQLGRGVAQRHGAGFNVPAIVLDAWQEVVRDEPHLSAEAERWKPRDGITFAIITRSPAAEPPPDGWEAALARALARKLEQREQLESIALGASTRT